MKGYLRLLHEEHALISGARPTNEDGLAVYVRAWITVCQSVYGQSNVCSNMALGLGRVSLSWIFLDHESGAGRRALSICPGSTPMV